MHEKEIVIDRNDEPDRLFGVPLLLRGVRERLLLSTVGLGDRIFSTSLAFGEGERLLDFDDRASGCTSFGSDNSLESFGFGDAEPDRSEVGEAMDLFISFESFNGDGERDLDILRLLDRDTPFSGSLLLSGLIGVSTCVKQQIFIIMTYNNNSNINKECQ